MPALFTRRADRVLRAVLVVAAALLVGAPTLLLAWVRSPHVTGQYREIEQPILFDHRHHVKDDGIDCRYCHDSVEKSPFAGVPPTATCMNCHGQIWNESKQIELVRKSYFEDEPIHWNRVHRLPDFVYFDHSIHVGKGVGCEECHGRVDEMPGVYQAAPLTMGWCIDCHRDPGPHLRPREAVTVMGWKPDGDRAALGAALAARYGVRRLTHCTTCHR